MTGRLDRYLRTLHGHGYWISAWYPIHGGADFECRLADGSTRAAAPWWGVHADPLEALAEAMRKAHLPTEDWDEDTEAGDTSELLARIDQVRADARLERPDSGYRSH